MKVHIITAANRALYGEMLAGMHRQRHALFVETYQWSALQSVDGLEIDEYDDEHAVYFLAIEDDQLFGSFRMLPAWRRSLTKDRFAHFVTTEPLPVEPDTWEWTRWVPGPLSRPRDLIRSRRALFLASLEFAASRGVVSYAAVCDLRCAGELEELGWSPRPLGMPTPYPEGVAVAIRWPVEPGLLGATRRLFRHPWAASFEAPAPADPEIADAGPSPTQIAAMLSLRGPQALAEIDCTLDRWRAPAPASRGHLHRMIIEGNA